MYYVSEKGRCSHLENNQYYGRITQLIIHSKERSTPASGYRLRSWTSCCQRRWHMQRSSPARWRYPHHHKLSKLSLPRVVRCRTSYYAAMASSISSSSPRPRVSYTWSVSKSVAFAFFVAVLLVVLVLVICQCCLQLRLSLRLAIRSIGLGIPLPLKFKGHRAKMRTR
jgi:hypothetical protein